jgi:uncharacterized OB-fold protein
MTLMMLAMIGVFGVVAVRSMSNRRRAIYTMVDRPCVTCGKLHPPFANYCGSCGRQL